jgi:hypothetical protein
VILQGHGWRLSSCSSHVALDVVLANPARSRPRTHLDRQLPLHVSKRSLEIWRRRSLVLLPILDRPYPHVEQVGKLPLGKAVLVAEGAEMCGPVFDLASVGVVHAFSPQ